MSIDQDEVSDSEVAKVYTLLLSLENFSAKARLKTLLCLIIVQFTKHSGYIP